MNTALIEALMARMRAEGVIELDYSCNGERIRLVRESEPTEALASVAPALVVDEGTPSNDMPLPTQIEIRAQMAGQFYTCPGPGEAPFVTVNDEVTEGAPLYILEVMKMLNRMEAEFPCRIVAVLCENGTAVEIGTPLFRVERMDHAEG
ncbi:acetyl-CoA carboxylase biotin carboxyl carrier protein [Acetobacter aceti]|uniref:Biotin carboxyl carrier protein of acetyl-CoA carboxylase n=1 Tax=Acetobacter aceti TaxID=435 RepID=A0A6S6PLQ7_ACEAC|nr:biotin/lipoyl-containing protein [Acetobacter aceti]BCI68758.1 acetyl-CoA carboxylase, biotin carboxyl carrier protein [Acetobacter aceti]